MTEKSHLKVDYTSVELDLPMGITSMEQWGRTVISFGKYAEANVTYNEMLTARSMQGTASGARATLQPILLARSPWTLSSIGMPMKGSPTRTLDFCSQELRWSPASSERSMWDLCTMSSGLAFNGVTAGWEQVQ